MPSPEPSRAKHRWHFDLERVGSLVAAVVTAYVGYLMVSDLYLLDHRGEVVDAIVLDKRPERGGPRIDVRYVTLTGETITNDTTNFLDAEVGQTIQVVYDPENPHRMQSADYGFDYWMSAVFFGGAAVFFLVWGIRGLRA
jgi:hypothetical protein